MRTPFTLGALMAMNGVHKTHTRFGIIGCGSAAVPVCEAIANSGWTTLAVVHDVNAALADEMGTCYGVPKAEQLADLLDADIDAVYIAVPHHLLAPLAKQALEAGKHTLVEKPMALTLDDANQLIGLAEAKALALGVFYELRYTSGFIQARSLVQAGVLGEIVGARIQTLIDKPLSYWGMGYTGRSVNPWRGEKIRAGGGVTLMNASHLLDGLWYMTGLEVMRVTAEMGTLAARVEVEDTLAATLRLENGAIGSLFASAHSIGAKGDERIEIYGTRGTLRVPDPYHNHPPQIFLREGWNQIPSNVWHTLPFAPTNVFEDAVADFARAVQAHERAPINGQDARRVLQCVLGMYHAARERRAVELNRKEIEHATN